MDPKWNAILGLAQLIMTAFLGVIAWMGKRVVQGIDDRIKTSDERINTLENQHVHREEFERLRTGVDDAVSKEEWLRSYGSTHQILKQMNTKIDELKGGQDAAVQIGAAVAAALNRIKSE